MAAQGKNATKQFSSSTTSMGSDEDLKVYCQPCDRGGSRLPAHGYCTNCSEHLCETCLTHHRRHTLSRHHALLDKTNMPQTLSLKRKLSSLEIMAVQGKKATKQFSSSKTSMGSGEDLKVYCQPCDRDGSRPSAHGYCTNCSEHLCETCLTHHRRHTLSRHHALLDKTNMPKTLSPAIPRQPDNFTKPCPKHNIEMIKFYCHDHKALLCSVCVTLEHTVTFCNVNYIPDISDQTINCTEYQDVLKDLNSMAERSSKILQDMKIMNELSNKSLTEALTNILKFRKEINQRLDEMEREVKLAAEVIQEDNSKNLKSVETVCGEVSKSLKSSSDAIKHFITSKQANDLFMELKHAEQMIKEYEQKVSKLSEFEVKEYKFETNEVISNLFAKEKSLGTLKGRILSPALRSRQCSQMDKIGIKTSQDRRDCWIAGMTLLTLDLLIITDKKGHKNC